MAKLEDMSSCTVTKEEFRGRGLCKRCVMFIVCSTAMSPNAREIIANARAELGLSNP